MFSSQSFAGTTVASKILSSLIPAVFDKQQMWQDSFDKRIDSDAQMLESIKAISDIQVKQEEISKQNTIENPNPDLNGNLTRKTAESSKWKKANSQEKYLSGLMNQSSVSTMTDKKNNIQASDRMLSDNIDSLLEENEDDPIKNKLINAATIFYPKTYKNIEKKKEGYESQVTKPKESGIESQLVDARNTANMVVGPQDTKNVSSDAVLANPKSSVDKFDSLAMLARKSLAFSGLNKQIALRTNVKGGGLGLYIKNFVADLNEKTGRDDFTEYTKEMPDDVSKYEFMDFLFSKVMLNPSWHFSLSSMPKKELETQKIQMYAMLNILNWETSQMLKKILATSATDLAVSVDKGL
ncbi:MAG: hypothetical protein OIF36_01020 [Alphaproteobacteria bacterium]|nr:hypothetical protein [Alphaproteobacteria bacterium]